MTLRTTFALTLLFEEDYFENFSLLVKLNGELKSRNERFVLARGGYKQKADRKLRA